MEDGQIKDGSSWANGGKHGRDVEGMWMECGKVMMECGWRVWMEYARNMDAIEDGYL